MDLHLEARASTPRAVDLRRGRAPEIEIVDSAAYDLLLSLHVTLTSMDMAYDEYDIGRAWIARARATCEREAPGALEILGRHLGDSRPSSLQATLISLVGRCPQPCDARYFLDWLPSLSTRDFAEALLDQEGLGAVWTSLLQAALDERDVTQSQEPGPATLRLLEHYPREARATAKRVLMDVERVRSELVEALRGWYHAVFAQEEQRIEPLVRHAAETMKRRRAEMPQEAFIECEMRGVQWQRPTGLRRIIFAPSYFCKPAVFYHLWRGVLTFCAPIESSNVAAEEARPDPIAPAEETLRFFEALGDSSRLRILRLLADKEMYLTELADRLGLTKATTKHHMVRLRAAGIVTLYDRERLTYYALRPDVARRAAHFLDALMGMGLDGHNGHS